MKQYNKPEIMLFDAANENIALEFNSNYLSTNNEGGYIAPKVDDVW